MSLVGVIVYMIRFPRLRLPALGTGLLFLGLSACDSSTDPGPPSCDSGEGVQLQVGEAAQFQGRDARIVCVTSPGSSAEYVLVTFAANTSSSEGIALAVRGENILPPTAGTPPGEVAPMVADRRTRDGDGLDPHPELLRDSRLDRQLREIERRELGRLLRPGPWAAGPSGAVATGTQTRHLGRLPELANVPTTGDFLEINTRTTSPCDDPRYRTGRVVAVSEKAIVVADTLNPSNGFTEAHYQHFAASFDTLIAPLGEAAFGEASDVSENGRTILFFTQDVNRLSEPNSDQFVGGFFFARDLFPQEDTPQLSACEHSNETELLYLLVPDPNGTINGNQRSLDFVERVTLTTMIHELQHLINAAQRLFVVQIQSTDQFETVWLNEGLSHIAEELLLYATTPFEAGQNLEAADFPANSPLRVLFNRYQVGNLFRFESFLEDPSGNSPYNSQDLLPTRGATWHFLRYAADRRGGNQTAFFRGLVATTETGLQNLADALTPHGPALSQWFTDWSVALYADDQVPGIETRFRDRSWNHRSFFAVINADQDPTYPLRLRSLEHGTVLAVSLMGGGAAYFRFGLGAGNTGLVELTTAGGNPPAGLRASLLRVN
jgi:hypothetical protein